MPRKRTLEDIFNTMFDDDAIVGQTGHLFDPYECDDWDDDLEDPNDWDDEFEDPEDWDWD